MKISLPQVYYKCNVIVFKGFHSQYIQWILSGGEDYNTSVYQIAFTSGSIKDDRQCFNITIDDDLLLEGNETFVINVQAHAENIPSYTSGSGEDSGSSQSGSGQNTSVNIRGAFNSSTGSISVTIVDDDGK